MPGTKGNTLGNLETRSLRPTGAHINRQSRATVHRLQQSAAGLMGRAGGFPSLAIGICWTCSHRLAGRGTPLLRACEGHHTRHDWLEGWRKVRRRPGRRSTGYKNLFGRVSLGRRKFPADLSKSRSHHAPTLQVLECFPSSHT